jgi:hypothetical protein
MPDNSGEFGINLGSELLNDLVEVQSSGQRSPW